jgi:hypothetical protein
VIAAIPTLYRDVQFRSRLEARWAAFFDLSGWNWKYEPVDLEGWTPDFVLKGAANDVLVEVKPIEWAQNFGPEQILQHADVRKAMHHRTEAFDQERLKTEILVIGDGPQRVGPDWVLGVFADESHGVAPDWAILCDQKAPGRLDFCSSAGCYAYRISGDWNGNSHIVPINDERPMTSWRWAGNATQYKAPFSGVIGPLLDHIAKSVKPKDSP